MKKICFPFTKNKDKLHCRGGTKALQHWENPPQIFSHSQKPMKFDPTTTEECVSASHVSVWTPQNPYIPTHWASTHKPPGFPKLSQQGGTGWRQACTPGTFYPCPAAIRHPTTKGKENNREGKWPVWGLIERNAKPFVGQASHILLEFLSVKEQNNSCEIPSPATTTGIPDRLLRTISEYQSFPRALEWERECTSCMRRSVTYASTAACPLAPPFPSFPFPSLSPSFSPSLPPSSLP